MQEQKNILQIQKRNHWHNSDTCEIQQGTKCEKVIQVT